MITMRDIAAAAGVSRSTVSFALSGRKLENGDIPAKTRKRIIAAAKKLGYRKNAIAQSMITGKSNFIIFASSEGLSWEYESRTLAGAVEEAQRRGCFVKITTFSQRDVFSRVAAKIAEQRPAGVLFRSLSDEMFTVAVNEFHRHGIPFATAGDTSPHPAGIRVSSDDIKGAEEAVEHLLSLDHRDIAFAAPNLVSGYSTRRYQGFLNVMRELRIKTPRNKILLSGYPEKLELMMLRLFSSADRPSAIFCAGDNHAMSAVRACRRAGLRVPDDLSVVGYADMIMASFCDPPLTTVKEPFELIGGTACAMLLSEIESGDKKSFVLELSRELPVKLIVRESTAGIDSAHR
jgi:DNA-binding LacI/PurR family transcriptional regulator